MNSYTTHNIIYSFMYYIHFHTRVSLLTQLNSTHGRHHNHHRHLPLQLQPNKRTCVSLLLFLWNWNGRWKDAHFYSSSAHTLASKKSFRNTFISCCTFCVRKKTLDTLITLLSCPLSLLEISSNKKSSGFFCYLSFLVVIM